MNTALRLLSLVFKDHTVRTIVDADVHLFVAKDIFDAAEIKATRDAYRRLKEYERTSCLVDTLGGKQTMVCLTEAGVYHVLFASQKPAAEEFRRWLAEEVIPQLVRFGSYLPGATDGEQSSALYNRWKQFRSSKLDKHSTAYEASGLLTITAFRKLDPVPGEDALMLHHHLRAIARERGFEPERYFTGKRAHTPAWPREMLAQARTRANGVHAFRFSSDS